MPSGMVSLRGLFPPVYRPLLDAFFDRPVVEERRATCDDCAMCDKGQPSPVPMEYFLPDAKCCTYFPQLPNYLVGAILADPSPDVAEGKKRLRAIIASRIGVTPHHVTRPRKMALILNAYGPGFGRAKSLLCPFFDRENLNASCTIWRHRETVCMTYYCKYEGGQRGHEFWNSLKWYAGYAQRRLTRAAAGAVDASVIEPVLPPNELNAEDLDDLPPKPADYAKWWGAWVGREEEFYLKCHEWVEKTSPAAYQTNVDRSPEGEKILADLVSKYERATNKLVPAQLVRNPRMQETHLADKVVVTTYSRFDSLVLDRDLFEVVGRLRANASLEENLAKLKKEGIEIVPELVEYLYAAGVLVEPSAIVRAGAAKTSGGELEGRRLALLTILDARGMAPSAAASSRIASADVVTLDGWIRKAATATALEEVIEDAG
jgi:Fe-S-cluster containining protein